VPVSSSPGQDQAASATADQDVLTRWRARTLRRFTAVDLAYGGAVIGLVALVLWSGHAAARHLSPSGAQGVSSLLDDLELPTLLPNAVLVRDDGASTKLWDASPAPRTLVSFYAPWCAPCQEELPMLVRATAAHPGTLMVVVGPDEEPVEVRKKLDNLGLKDLRYYVDAKRELETGGRVTALPTTFLIGKLGRVQERIVGYSGFRVQMLAYKALGGEMPSFEPDVR
jgi:thiol-disulfide isomerase/thioredoxin